MEKLHKLVDGVKIELTEEEEKEVRVKWAANDLKQQKIQYKKDRKVNYPSIQDQLDHIYHNGFDSWKSIIKSIKDKYPKPQ